MEYAGEASKLIRRTEGKLWNYCTTNERLAKEIENNYKITAKQFTESGTKFKILSDFPPFEDASPAEVTLEDAYI